MKRYDESIFLTNNGNILNEMNKYMDQNEILHKIPITNTIYSTYSDTESL